jgi:cytochrome c-type biogenesis protein
MPGMPGTPAFAVADSTIASGALPLAALVAALAGLISFASPCVLPLVPGFLGYVTGLSQTSLEQRRRSRLILGALLFVVGFSVVFVASITAASVAGAALIRYQTVLTRAGGVLVILLALVFLGMGAQRELGFGWRPAAGLAGAPLLGAGLRPSGGARAPDRPSPRSWPWPAPSAGTRPLRAESCSARHTASVWGCPSSPSQPAGQRATRASAWVRRHQRGVQRTGGALLLLVGVLMATGLWEGIMSWVQAHLVTGFEVVL